jgi:hypothetical protein
MRIQTNKQPNTFELCSSEEKLDGTSPRVVLSWRTLHVRSADPPSRGNDTSQKVDPIGVPRVDCRLSRGLHRTCARAP